MKTPSERADNEMNTALAITDPTRYWNCWSSNYQPERDGYCIHVFDENSTKGTALCGAPSMEGGGLNLTETHVSCRRCQASLRKRGVAFNQ